ncbi:MAG TPA: hypothetical protein DCR98_14595, partial [Cobetia sp.]|nr:hypothetical protein [Cobetia sp.]
MTRQSASSPDLAPSTAPSPSSVSYVSGISDLPLKGQTIGDCFDETVSRFPDQDALISRHQGLRYR